MTNSNTAPLPPTSTCQQVQPQHVAPSPSTSTADIIATFPVNLRWRGLTLRYRIWHRWERCYTIYLEFGRKYP
ncbi:MAG: hypothetical protein R2788_20255 [Saprospiraceae bacterium]